MAHLPPSAAIFSPSVARAAASAAKDWSYVDSWLQRKFPGSSPPPFERNADTLRALMALASANEAADEERALIARLEAETLDQLRAHERQQQTQAEANQSAAATLQSAREAILTALEASLPREGQTALTALAALALQTGDPLPSPSSLGAELISLSASAATLEQTISRIRTLTAHIAREAAATSQLAAELRPPSPGHHHPDDDDGDGDGNGDGDAADPAAATTTTGSTTAARGAGYHPPPTLALQNLALQRQIKSLSSQIPALRDKAAALARSQGGVAPSPSLAQVREEEEAYLALLSLKEELDAQVRAFAGLPHDTELARRELEGLREELRRLEARRDEVFEGLVERETPRKPRR
ncbi:hypothetical protein MYCTH_2309223 [Thermothelomyces thermophilus ATCC 42464]|uniref:HAUS augmin-like complex subunit 1 n=1 Tax=Thermothelomyces thermophilus (strain ATCC 42464 / BCRC 31852 / DSM 1799) TaxID=573729 RepID=G2QI29_THET4|nr:uncharacterized protein MYCTH_2309223 [Thermothelomyces thermophilus ATCC 42464]AEO60218.1 hypothetical protein MYCTH_2309223 [Thermothelomyces thermophilus ATCC 42464]